MVTYDLMFLLDNDLIVGKKQNKTKQKKTQPLAGVEPGNLSTGSQRKFHNNNKNPQEATFRLC